MSQLVKIEGFNDGGLFSFTVANVLQESRISRSRPLRNKFKNSD